MAFKKDSDRGDSDREMIQGNWTCSECGTKITEMPFEPSADRPIFCRDCWSKKRESRPRNNFGRNNFGPRKMFQGNWKCSECGTAITELPFEPSGDTPLFCRECFSKKRAER